MKQKIVDTQNCPVYLLYSSIGPYLLLQYQYPSRVLKQFEKQNKKKGREVPTSLDRYELCESPTSISILFDAVLGGGRTLAGRYERQARQHLLVQLLLVVSVLPLLHLLFCETRRIVACNKKVSLSVLNYFQFCMRFKGNHNFQVRVPCLPIGVPFLPFYLLAVTVPTVPR